MTGVASFQAIATPVAVLKIGAPLVA